MQFFLQLVINSHFIGHMDGAKGIPANVSCYEKSMQRCPVSELMVGHRTQSTIGMYDPFLGLLGIAIGFGHQVSPFIERHHIQVS